MEGPHRLLSGVWYNEWEKAGGIWRTRRMGVWWPSRQEGGTLMSPDDEIRRRVPPANRAALEIPHRGSIFEATDNGRTADAAVYNVRDGRVLIGRAMTHQGLVERYAPHVSIDDCVRVDIFVGRERIEFDTCRAAVPVGFGGDPVDDVAAWEHLYDAVEAFRRMGLPGNWHVYIDGEEVGT